MRFVQIITLTTDRFDDLEAAHEAWRAATEGERTAVRELVCEERGHPGRYHIIVEFPDHDAAQRNNDLAATAEIASRIGELATDGPEFLDLDVRRLDEA
jgi:hypothetical protein